mmetsp:Transcript_10467/g.36422  ORF Transcript_10467/g.36422 Transcript_10467/m.36422 type:complete len:264 (+) Transcript_10467:888-1679(+)
MTSPTHAIRYPPLAATCSTHTTSFRPAALTRSSCAAASPYPVTVPPPVERRTSTSSPRDAFAPCSTAVTSSRRARTWEARTSPLKSSTKTCLRSEACPAAPGFTASGSSPVSQPGVREPSWSSSCRRSRCPLSRAAETEARSSRSAATLRRTAAFSCFSSFFDSPPPKAAASPPPPVPSLPSLPSLPFLAACFTARARISRLRRSTSSPAAARLFSNRSCASDSLATCSSPSGPSAWPARRSNSRRFRLSSAACTPDVAFCSE